MRLVIASQLRIVSQSARCLHSSPSVHFPRKPKDPNRRREPQIIGIPAPSELMKTGLLLDETELERGELTVDEEGEKIEEGNAGAYLYLEQQRELLRYMRLIEHDMPNLVRWRKTFSPPSSDTPLVVRTIDYGGEDHPATAKRVIVAAVARLPLTTPRAIENFKLLSGSRWTPSPPKDSGISETEGGGEHGFIKIACEDFPQPGMNLKWASDILDKLITHAETLDAGLAGVPPDTRHVVAKLQKARKGDYYHGRTGQKPSLRDFPKEWLPKLPAQGTHTT